MIKPLAFIASCFLCVIGIAGTAYAWNIGPNSFELLSYQGSDYKFLIIPRDATLLAGFEQPNFDDTAFGSGSAAFGSVASGGGCPLNATDQTPWPVNSQLLVRRVIAIPAGATQVQIRVSVDNDIVGVFFNGTRVQGPLSHDGCPIRDQVVIDVPQELVQPGQSLVVFQVLDRGAASFFDARIIADLSLPVLTSSLFDLGAIVDRQLPIIPMKDINVTCPGGAKEISVTWRVEATGANAAIKINRNSLTEVTTRSMLDGNQIARVRKTINNTSDGGEIRAIRSTTIGPTFPRDPNENDLTN